ncbi:MAG: hypothetical protein QOE36_137 [Gaiellaceae bacterium]|nr:hypothetical protein [Gaiellaceae bacterium]
MGARFVAVGEVMLDISTEAIVPGERRHAPVRVRAGGSPVTAALSAAHEGVTSGVVGCVGADAAGRAVRADLESAGLEARLDVDDDLPTGTFLEADGGRTVVADRGANARLRLPDGDIRAEAALVSGYFLFNEAPDDTLGRLRADWLAVDAGSARLVEKLGGEEALRRMTGANALFADDEEARALGSPDELAERFRLVCVKRGAAGATATLDGVRATAEPPEKVATIRSGAGDAFAGALLASLLLGRELPDALARACAAGARIASGG